MSKTGRPSLDLNSLGESAGKTHNPVEVIKHRKKGTSKGRDGRVQIAGWYDPSYRKGMKALAAMEDTSVEALLQEAMEDLFKKHSFKKPV